MSFDIAGKVALVTGGAQGFGYECAKDLLRNNAKGVVIADINTTKGEECVTELNKLYGQGKAVFIRTDTTDKDQYEKAFELAVERFKHIDILVNNAGILNDAEWQKCVDININGYINGIILAMETYLRNFKSTNEAVILNTCSIGALSNYPVYPIYCSTKYAVAGMTRTWGNLAHFDRTEVRVVAICPGLTETNLAREIRKGVFKEEYFKTGEIADMRLQSADHVGKQMVNVVKYGKCGSLYVVEKNLPPYEYVFPEIRAFKENVLKIV